MKKTLVNFMYQAIYQLALIILPIITIPIISKALGPSGVGTWNYIQSIMNYFLLLAGLGLANYGVREVAVVRRNRYKLSITFWQLELFNFFFTLLTLVLYLVIALFLKNTYLYFIQSLVLFGAMFDITWFFAGIEDFKKITIAGISIKLISFLLIVSLVKNKDDLVWYVMIQSLSILLNQAILWLFIHRYVDFYKVSIKSSLKHLRPALRFFISKIASTVYMNLNKTVLGIITSMAIVGFYSNALTLVMLSGSLITALNTVMIPKMSSLYSEKSESNLMVELEKSLHFQLLLTIPLMFGIILVTPKMINWFFGSQFIYINKLIPFLAPVVIFQALQSGIAAQYLIPKNDMKAYNRTVIFGAIVSLICDITLIPFIGAFGAVISTLLGQATICIVRVKVLILNTSFRFDLIRIIKFLVSGLLMYLITNLVTDLMTSSPITTVLQIVIGIIIYFIFIIVFRAYPPELKKLLIHH